MPRYCVEFDLAAKRVTLHNQTCREYYDTHLLMTNRATDLGAHRSDGTALRIAGQSYAAVRPCIECCPEASSPAIAHTARLQSALG